MDPFESKLFEGATVDQKLEISIRALGEAAKVFTLASEHLSRVVDRLDEAVKRFDQKSWEKAIHERIEERKRNGAPS